MEMEEQNESFEADVKSNTGSLRPKERDLSQKNNAGNPKEKDHGDPNSQSASRKSGKILGLRNEDYGDPSNYYSDSSSDSHKMIWSSNYRGVNNAVQNLDQDRAELVRKLDEIKEQLIRNPDLVDKPKESDQPSMPFIGPGKHVSGPSHFHQYPEPFPYAGAHQIPMHGVYRPTSNSTRTPGYGDPYGFQMHRRLPPNFFPGQYHNQPHFPGQYVDIGLDIFESNPQDSIFHPYFPAPPSWYVDLPHSPASYHHEKFALLSQSNFNNPRTSSPSPSSSYDPQTQKRWQNDVDSETGFGDFARGYAPKVVSTSGARRCRPIAGGAPFITCHNCFELFQLPKKVLKKPQKLQCGVCSEVVSFSIVKKKLVLSSGSRHEETTPVSREVDGSSYIEDLKGTTTSNSCPRVNRPRSHFSSVDYDNSGYEYQSMDKEPIEALRKPQDMQSFDSSSSIEYSEDEKDVHCSNPGGKVVNSLPVKEAKAIPPPPGSSLQDLFEFSTANREALSYGMAILGFQSGKEYTVQNSIREESMVTEMDVSLNGYSNTEVSEDSRDGSRREDDQPRRKKSSDSAFVNIFKGSLRSQDGKKGKYEVWVNGHLIPDDLVKDAEKMAGPIQPGNYWYDYRAGFWGMMGKPCLGMIMPFIEEFNYPMPDNCAAGNTGVFVNGRELHQRDLDLLARRGLPADKNRSYIIDISGRVLDGDSGEKLNSLGKLAPTVERLNKGFGMRVLSA